MPTAPPHLCPTPHCGALVHGSGPCPKCRAQRDRTRGTAAARGYDWQWANYSRAWLRRYPWCGQRYGGSFHGEHSRCWQDGRRVAAQVTDHIVALRDGGARLDPRNHQSLCYRCNVLKSVPR
jgi:5-methylcytosine-specific restriction endonuclease McrA